MPLVNPIAMLVRIIEPVIENLVTYQLLSNAGTTLSKTQHAAHATRTAL